MSGLESHLEALIRAQGPLTLGRFMAEALGNPRHGYYMRGDPFGREGDFITAPEISQMFGELLGLWCAATWESLARPTPVNLVELGPGRGTLMADALRACQAMPAFRRALRPVLVETSPALRLMQQGALADTNAIWCERLAEVPEAPMLLIANEFFDALPVQQFERTPRGWCERLVDLADPDGGGDDDRFRFVLSARPTPASALIPRSVRDAPEGSVAEVSAAALSLAGDIGARVAAGPVVALIVDYGRVLSEPGESVQAVRGHRRHALLAAPGSADITAHVDFEALAQAAREGGARVHGPVAQGAFLTAIGIETRAAALLRASTPEQRVDIASALGRLTDPTQMGSLFKVLALTPHTLEAPFGFGKSA
jgi:NADH dehydrogenase [ubiquinone] 1 alpha subcomplex assembly factor 7